MDEQLFKIYEEFKKECGFGGMSKSILRIFEVRNNLFNNEIEQLMKLGYIVEVEEEELYYPAV